MLQWRIILFLFCVILIDLYFYRAIRTGLKNISTRKKDLLFYIYFSFTAVTILYIIISLIYPPANWPKFFKVYTTSFFFIVQVSKLTGLLLLAADDIARGLRWLLRIFQKPSLSDLTHGRVHRIPRSKFISQAAIVTAGIPFASLIYGMAKGAFDYEVHRVKLALPNLPSSFEGIKIIQLSDIHSGSFTSSNPLIKATEIINNEQADYIFFTGDLVNDKAEEAEYFLKDLSLIKAKKQIFSILGNHDYGDYVIWSSKEAKEENMQRMYQVHRDLGWKLLLNQNTVIEKGGDKIAVIGVENWGVSKRFPKYGDLDVAMKNVAGTPVKFLLSHDPTHWDAKVREKYPDINVTFSGHTHGMQFGIETPGFRWSPSQYIFKQWAGLYKESGQQLYVNRGLGFLGYSGRVGINPEITVFELTRS